MMLFVLGPPLKYQKTISLLEDLISTNLKVSLSLYRQRDDVRTSSFSEIETAIDARERKKTKSIPRLLAFVFSHEPNL